MKWERTDLTVGAVVVLSILIVASALAWTSFNRGRGAMELYTAFDRIDGIAERAVVQLHGYPIGRVEAIEPRADAEGRLFFRVRLSVSSRLASGDTLRLPEGTRAVLTPPAVPIGSGVVVLETPAEGGIPLLSGATIPGTRAFAALDQVQTLTTDLGGEVTQTLAGTRSLMDSLAITLGRTNQALQITTASLPSLLGGLQEELVTVNALTADARVHMGELMPRAGGMMDSVTIMLGQSREMLTGVSRLLTQQEDELVGMMANVDTTLYHIKQITRRPYRIFTGVRTRMPEREPAASAAASAAAPRDSLAAVAEGP
jgi:ABC-type transporter Mla subunit MlaD